MKRLYKKYENKIIAAALLFLLLAAVGFCYDYYYDLNDDVTIKDILSGVYTGTPEALNIQILYPLSLVISLCYRMLPDAPVYGIFLCLCQYGCLFLVLERSLHFCRSTVIKMLAGAVETAALCALLLNHLIFVQYTFTSAMLAAAAAFLFITIERGLSLKQFLIKSVPCMLLAVLSYLLRTEMLTLLLPLICVAGVYRWSMEQEIFIRENFIKYGAVFGGILAGMLLGTAADRIAFSSGEWPAYVKFFNSRTELYDFQGLPSYAGNEALYEGLEMTESEQYMLLDQYNFGLDDTLDAAALDMLSDYQAEKREETASFTKLLLEKAKLYRYRTFHKEPAGSGTPDDYPWNYMVLLAYLTVFAAILQNAAGKKNGLRPYLAVWKMFFLFCVRTALWMFILIRGRDPVRITHSLYLMELFILMAMLFTECSRMQERRKQREEKTGLSAAGASTRLPLASVMPAVLPALLAAAALLCLPGSLEAVSREYGDRAAANEVYLGMKEYCLSHKENFYFMDVYSSISYPYEPYLSVPYSEKMFADTDNSLGNYDIMGGWLVKSPYYEKKLRAFSMDSMAEGILYQDRVYVMAELDKGTDYLTAYFADQGVPVTVTGIDEICGIIGVYNIEVKTEAAGRE